MKSLIRLSVQSLEVREALSTAMTLAPVTTPTAQIQPPPLLLVPQRPAPGTPVELNPQPLPPGGTVELNPQPLPPGGTASLPHAPSSPGGPVQLNPQPLPPRIW